MKEVKQFIEIFVTNTTSPQQVIEAKPFNLNFSRYLLSPNYPQPSLINLISEYKPYR